MILLHTQFSSLYIHDTERLINNNLSFQLIIKISDRGDAYLSLLKVDGEDTSRIKSVFIFSKIKNNSEKKTNYYNYEKKIRTHHNHHPLKKKKPKTTNLTVLINKCIIIFIYIYI